KNFVNRFLREIKIISTLNHPNILKLYDYGVTDGTPYFVTEYIQGKTLKELLSEGKRFSIKQSIKIIIEVLYALSHARSKGVIAHRDIKPGNIMIDKDWNVKLMDFGIAKFEGTQITQDTIMYTPTYASPEQIKGENVDIRSDLYSIGCTLYELLTGRPPFLGTGTLNISFKHINEQPVPPSTFNKNIDKDLDNIVLKLLAKNPSDRYQSPEEVIKELIKFTSFKKEVSHDFSTKLDENKQVSITPQAKTFKKSFNPVYILIVFILISLISIISILSSKNSGNNNLNFSYITINTTPSEAMVYIDDRDVGLSPIFNYKILSGEHKIKIFKEGYEEKLDTIVLKNNESKTLNYVLNIIAKIYKISIDTKPSEAKVYIDNEYIGLTPLEYSTSRNQINLKIKKDNYEDYEENIVLSDEFKNINISLKEIKPSTPVQPIQKEGKLSIKSEPSGADVFIDGKLIGKTPLIINLKIGNYKVEIKKDGYLTYILPIQIKENKEYEYNIPLHLISNKGRVVVNVNETGSLIYLNGEVVGHTSINIEIDPGHYRLEVRKEGYLPHLEEFDIKPGETIKIDVYLAKLP
ncbi:MAG: serine/threonine protein kinase, partial [Caldisericia bacterium]|nr:serine/threonine protein kinase [Caldisericia bacterium]